MLIIVPQDSYDFDNDLLNHVKEPLLVDFIKKCLILDPERRMNIEEAFTHPFLRKRF